jgi:hypothetical protein
MADGAGEDELGNFFAELEEIETNPTVATTDTDPLTAISNSNELTAGPADQIQSTASSEVTASAPMIGPSVTVVAAAAAPSVTYSKPAELHGKISSSSTNASHAVYTYEDYATLPQYSSADLTPANPYASSSSGAAQQQAAPMYIPRSDKKFVRKAADEVWVDDTLQEWPENDFRIFVGDLAKETTTEHLTKTFQHLASFAKAKVSISIFLLHGYRLNLSFINLLSIFCFF